MVYDFGYRLKKLRKNKRMTQEGAAKRLGVSKTTISGYENNVKNPSLDNKSKFHTRKSEEQRQVAVTTVAQRARRWWEPAHTMAVNGFVRSAEKGLPRYLPPCPHVTAEGYLCERGVPVLGRSFAVYLFKGNVSFPN